MKAYKLVLSLCVIAVALFSCAWIFGLVNFDGGLQFAAKIIGAILVISAATFIIGSMMRSNSNSSSQNGASPRDGGPRF